MGCICPAPFSWDPQVGRCFLIDRSSNGTFVNGKVRSLKLDWGQGKVPAEKGYGEIAVGGVMKHFFFEFSAPETWGKKGIPNLMT